MGAEGTDEPSSGPAMPETAPGSPETAPAERADRTEQRAETMRVLTRMAALPADDPERARLRDEVVEDHMPYARHIAQRYGGRGASGEDFEQVAYLGLVKAVDNFDPEHDHVRAALIEVNLPLVRYAAARFRGRSEPMEDVVQVGTIGLINAIDRFDPLRGVQFPTYALPTILGEIKRYFRDATWGVHVPRRMQELSGALRKATDTLTHDLGREPTIAELARHLGAEPEEIVEAIDAAGAYTTASLDHPVNSEEQGASLLDFMGEEDAGFDAVIDHQVLTELLTRLGERDKRILLMRYFRGMTQAEIGEELGVSQMQISRLLSRILKELRAGFG